MLFKVPWRALETSVKWLVGLFSNEQLPFSFPFSSLSTSSLCQFFGVIEQELLITSVFLCQICDLPRVVMSSVACLTLTRTALKGRGALIVDFKRFLFLLYIGMSDRH